MLVKKPVRLKIGEGVEVKSRVDKICYEAEHKNAKLFFIEDLLHEFFFKSMKKFSKILINFMIINYKINFSVFFIALKSFNR